MGERIVTSNCPSLSTSIGVDEAFGPGSSCSGQMEIPLFQLEAQLEYFFKSSPYEVFIREVGGQKWYMMRYRGNFGDRTPPPIRLVPVDEKTPPIIVNAASPTSATLLLLPMPANMPYYYLDLASYEIKSRSSQEYITDYPHYLAISREPQYTDSEIFLRLKDRESDLGFRYIAQSLMVQNEGRENDNFFYTRNVGGHRVPIIQGYIHPDWQVVEKTGVEAVARGESPEDYFQLILDVSGSMGSWDRFALRKLSDVFRQGLVRFYENKGIVGGLASGSDGRDLLARLSAFDVNVMFYAWNQFGDASEMFDLSFGDIVDESALLRLARGERVEVFQLVSLERLFVWLAAKKTGVVPVDTERGPAPGFVKSVCKDNALVGQHCVRYFSVTDDLDVDRAINPGIFISDSEIELDEVTWTENYSPELDVALRESLPLFVSLILFEDFSRGNYLHLSDEALRAKLDMERLGAEALIASFSAASETYIYHVLPRLYGVVLSEREKYYPIIKGIAGNERYDYPIRRRAVALLASWAVKGDENAKKILLGIFENPGKTNLIYSLYLAKCAALFLPNEDAERILSQIKSDPTNKKNYYLLVALAGKQQFVDALEFILTSVWSARLKVNPEYRPLLAAIKMVFSDPIVGFSRTDELDDDQIRTIAGVDWSGEQLQAIYELSEMYLSNLRSLSREGEAIETSVNLYAYTVLRPPWEEGGEVQINPVPTKRFWYKKSIEESEKALLAVSSEFRKEDSWVFAGNNDEDGYLFETGMLQLAVSVTGRVDWDFVNEKMTESGWEFPERIIDVHLHPLGDVETEMPERTRVLPSVIDFNAWAYFLFELNTRYPDINFRRVEFHIISKAGITVVRPSANLIRYARESSLVDGRLVLPSYFLSALSQYSSYIHENPNLFSEAEVQRILSVMFDIDFPKTGGY